MTAPPPQPWNSGQQQQATGQGMPPGSGVNGQPCGHLAFPLGNNDPEIRQFGLGAVALRYVRIPGLGLEVFPLKPGTKRPATTHGFKDATADEAVITGKDWWGGNRSFNVGVRTGGKVAVIDLDRKLIDDASAPYGYAWADGRESLPRWLAENQLALPPCPWESTPNGGAHLWLLTGGRPVQSRAWVLPGVDIRGDGGYVAAYPSQIRIRYDPDGRRRGPHDFILGSYTWTGCPCQAPLAPPELLDAMERLPGGGNGGGGNGGGGGGEWGSLPELPPTGVLAEHGVGHPHDFNLARLAGRLCAEGKTEEQAHAIWRQVADLTQDPGDPFTMADWKRHWDGAVSKGFGEAGADGEAMAWAAGQARLAAQQQAAAGQGMPPGQGPPGQGPDGQQPDRPLARIDCGGGGGPKAIRAVQQALNDGKIPGTYQVAGRVAIVWEGEAQTRGTSTHPLDVEAVPAGPAEMQNLLAHHTDTFRMVNTKSSGWVKTEYTPAAAHLSAVLSSRSWPGLRPLNGVIGAPVLRPDGTLLQEPGYDPVTGLYLAARVQDVQVNDKPREAAVAWARQFLLDEVLRDFPWVGPADKANYVAMLVTQVLRYYLDGAPVPFFPVTATDQGSGKTLLATLCGVLFGLASITWTGDDEELRKTLTSVMASQEGVIAFDNLEAGTVLRSAVLSKLLTDRTWGDRMLGKNVLAQFANDRLWCATGNNLRIGGDMATRVVLIGLDANMPHPERRGGFAIADLESWIRVPGNQQQVLGAVLVLAADWAAAGCPEADVVPFRQFTRWARACGGLLAHHGVAGFLANAGEVEAADDDETDWAGFLARWPEVLGGGAVTSEAVTEARLDSRWQGTFPTGKGDEPLESARSMGKRLQSHRNRYHGGRVLRGTMDLHGNVMTWWVRTWQDGA